MTDRRRPVFVAALVAMAIGLALGALADPPKPSPVPVRWELQFEPGPLRLYVDESSRDAYWYFTYGVINRTGDKQLWAPSFVLFTDAGEIMRSGRDVPSLVTDDLLELLGNELMEDQNEIIGDILQGREHMKEGLVIWPARNLRVNEMSLFVAGTSGETARVKNPITGADVILRKTLQRDYLIPGDALARGSQPIEMVTERWVMR